MNIISLTAPSTKQHGGNGAKEAVTKFRFGVPRVGAVNWPASVYGARLFSPCKSRRFYESGEGLRKKLP